MEDDSFQDSLEALHRRQPLEVLLNLERADDYVIPKPEAVVHKVYGYLNYSGGSSNFWVFGIETGHKLRIRVYPFKGTKPSDGFSLIGWGEPPSPITEPIQIRSLLNVRLSDYSRTSPYVDMITVPRLSELTSPPCPGDVSNVELSADGPVAFTLEVISESR